MKLYLSGKINRGCNRIPIIPFITTIELVTASVLKTPPNYSSWRKRNGQRRNESDIRPP